MENNNSTLVDDIWQTPSGRLIDIQENIGPQDICECGDYSFDPVTAKLLYRYGVFVGDLVNTSSSTRVIVVGARRFCRPHDRPYGFSWDWNTMRRVSRIDEKQTPLAYRRLREVNLRWDYTVDLLPPGDDWTTEDDQEAALSAAYIRGAAAAAGINLIVLLGGKVCKAFRAADRRVRDFTIGVEQHGYLPVPMPHARQSDFWDDPVKVAGLRETVRELLHGVAS